MKVSIVTPVFNFPQVGRALDSVFRQQLAPEHGHELETVVIDAGSTDGTLEALEPYRPRLDVLISEPDRGIFDGMNKGIQHATGEVVGILNSDDQYSDPFVLRDVLAEFQRPETAVCYGDIVYVDDAGRVTRYWKSGRNRRLKWHFGWMPPHPAFFVRRRVYEEYGLFNPEFRIAGDYELELRLLCKHRVEAAYLERVLVHMAAGGTANKSVGNVIKGNLEVGRAWRLNRLSGGQLVPFLKPSRKSMQFIKRPPPLPPPSSRVRYEDV